ncbi:MAG: 4-(cytidine 5'-diphospho)-2-C-methyl-D-erythritol kinase, partial [Dehalococcoidia bacterium]
MRLYAPAKINWTLEVLGRPDSYRGYHEIRTVLQTIDLADVIEVWPAADLRLEVIGPHQASEDDLVLKAARLLQEESGHRGGALIRLTKRIPVAAGLGGGSSDAAAVLRGLSQLWGLGWGSERLAAIAAVVSSDATFFLYGGTALAQGRGERIAPLPDVPPTRLVLVVPPWSLPDKTARMYQGLVEGDFSDGSRTQRLVRRLQKGEPPADSDLCNAFQRLA